MSEFRVRVDIKPEEGPSYERSFVVRAPMREFAMRAVLKHVHPAKAGLIGEIYLLRDGSWAATEACGRLEFHATWTDIKEFMDMYGFVELRIPSEDENLKHWINWGTRCVVTTCPGHDIQKVEGEIDVTVEIVLDELLRDLFITLSMHREAAAEEGHD